MLFALIVVALVAVGLAVALVLARNAAAEHRAQAEAREVALSAERDSLVEARRQLETDLSASKSAAEKLKAEVASQAEEVRRQASEIDEAERSAAEQQTRIEGQSEEIAALVAGNNDLQERVDAAREAERAALERAELAEARNVGVDIGEIESEGGAAQSLWDLEVLRSERTWRTSVAVNPSVPEGPFGSAEDPARLAVEVEAAALRENVGTFVAIDWQAELIDDPVRRHLTVRVAQELLEAAVRNPEPLRLVVSGTDDINLRLEPVDERADDVISIPLPTIDGEVIDVSDDGAVSVTVKAESASS